MYDVTAVLNTLRLVFGLSMLLILAACQQTLMSDARRLAQKSQEAAIYNVQLGLAYLKQGDRPRAKHKLLTALDLAPNSADVNAAIAYFFEKTGESIKAGIFYKKALSLAPNSGTQLNNYGSFLCRSGRYSEAEKYFLEAVKEIHYLNTAAAYENAGICAAQIPDYEKASRFFVKALMQNPQRKQALYELARVELKLNHAAKALAYMKRYPALVNDEPALISLAVKAASLSGNFKAEQAYKTRLKKINNSTDPSGASDEYDSNNG